MHYPSLAEYSDALQLSLGIALSDPVLSRGILRSRGAGQPVVRSGNFALTFEVVVDGVSYAVRCFHKPYDALRTRYDAIARHLRSIRSACFVDCEFQASGITTESGSYPIVRMDWAHGQTLAAFVAAHRADVAVLEQLRASLREVARELRSHGIAHGDIQPTNVIVESATSLRLIDYDGMFVPQLAGLQSAELGQRNFQHSGRRGRHFDAHLDSFSFSLLDVALDALCRVPGLWEQSGSDAGAFVFRSEDIADPAGSPVFRLLASVPGLEQRVRNFAAICAAPFVQVPAFEDFLAGRNIPARPIVFAGDPALSLRREYVPACDVVDATNFAQCCSHVGDRVEMIGRIVRVGMGTLPHGDTPCLRVEFADPSHDMACLKIWPEALTGRQDVPDASWVGQWVCAVGLLEPVHSTRTDGGYHKDVAISITDSSQLHRLSEREAWRCLRGRRSRTRPALDRTASVKTDRVLTDAARRPERVAAPIGVGPSRPVGVPAAAAPSAPSSRVPEDATVPATRPAPRSLRPGSAPDSAQPPAASSPRPVPVPAPARAHAPASPSLSPSPTPSPSTSSPGRSALPGARSWRTWSWVAATLLAAVAIFALLGQRGPSTPDSSPDRARDRSQSLPATTTDVPAEARVDGPEVAGRLESQESLRKVRDPVTTVAGSLTIGRADQEDARQVVALDGVAVPDLRDDVITLAHRAVFSDREIVVGFTQCQGSVAPCGLQQPFWLELRAGLPPNVRRASGLWLGAGTGAGTVVASTDGVQVDLGLWNGERRRASLTSAGNLAVARRREPRRPLSQAECTTVIEAAESCATSRDCSSFRSSARPIAATQWRRLTRLYHESTGLDAASLRALCVRSCELGLTPSNGFVRQRVCNGAPPGQWPADNPAAGL